MSQKNAKKERRDGKTDEKGVFEAEFKITLKIFPDGKRTCRLVGPFEHYLLFREAMCAADATARLKIQQAQQGKPLLYVPDRRIMGPHGKPQ